MNTKRLGMTEHKADRLLMGLQLDEQFVALNTPLRVRKAALRLTYEDHYPRLWVKVASTQPECVAFMDTRRKQMVSVRPKQDDNLLFCNHLFASMDKVECLIVLSYDIDPGTQRKRIKLQLRSKHSRKISHTLHWLWKGTSSHWLEEFTFDQASHPLAT